jgi:osmoprotectant transport system permease protein
VRGSAQRRLAAHPLPRLRRDLQSPGSLRIALLPHQAVARGEVDVIAAFSSDGRIAAFDLVVLDEPRNAIPPYDAVLLMGPRVADRPGIADALRPLIRGIPLDQMQRANQAVDVDQRPLSEAAEELDASIAIDSGQQ